MVTNIVMNLAVAGNLFMSMAPRYISYRGGVLISALLGALSCPFYLTYATAGGVSIVSVVGTLFSGVIGVMLADYYITSGRFLDVDELSYPRGRYWYYRGTNLYALLAVFIAFAVNLPGMLATFDVIDVPELKEAFSYAWIIGCVVAMGVYAFLMRFVATAFYEVEEMTEMMQVQRKNSYGGGAMGDVYAGRSYDEERVDSPEMESWKLPTTTATTTSATAVTGVDGLDDVPLSPSDELKKF